MANLSNINGKFVVEQTTGYVGVGTTDPEYLLHVNSSDIPNGTRLTIENTNGSGKKYGLISDNTGVFTVRDLTASSDRFSISNLGNANFTGTGTFTDAVTVNGSYPGLILNSTSHTKFAITNRYSTNYVTFDMTPQGGSTLEALTLKNNGFLGINRNSPNGLLHQQSAAGSNSEYYIQTGDTTTNSTIYFGDSDASVQGGIDYDHNDDSMSFKVNNSTRMVIDSSGNVGIAATPGTYLSSIRALRIGQAASFSAFTSSLNTYVSSNVRVDATGTNKAIVTGESAQYRQSDGTHIWYNAASVSAGATSTLTERMRIDSSGNVGIGTDDPDYPLHVKNSSTSYLFSETTGPGAAAGFRWKTPDSEFSWYSAGGLNNMNLYDYTASAVRMTIDSDGNAIFTKNVTVGTAAASDFVLSLRGGVGGFFGWDDSTNKTILQAPNTRQLSLRVNSDTFGAGTEAILIDSSGNVGIANSNPSGNAVGENGKSFIVGNESATAESASISIISGSGGYSYLLFGDGDGVSGYQGQVRYQHSSNNLQFVTGAAERMRIKSDGVITFSTTAGTSTPAGSINHASNNFLYVTGGIAGASFGDDSHATRMIVFDNNYLRFDTGGTERMRITSSGAIEIKGSSTTASAQAFITNDNSVLSIGSSVSGSVVKDISFNSPSPMMYIDGSTGNVGIGTTSPTQAKLVSSYDGTVNNGMAIINTNTGTLVQNLIIFKRNTTEVGAITSNNTTTTYGTGSDYRLKENVVSMTGALNRVSQLKPSRFNFIADADKTVDGFLAHEVQDIVPEAITGEKDAVDEEGNAKYQGIDQSKLVPLLVGAIQELKAEIEILKNK